VRNKTRPVKVYKFVTDYILKHGYGPTMAEIAQHIETSEESARRAVVDLIGEGKLASKYKSPRSLRLPKVRRNGLL